ncbi:unnamed protein product, partial [Rotaria sordida]
MAFIHGFNVNSEQRDQYISDTINVNTGPIVGKLSMIQSPKPSKQKYGNTDVDERNVLHYRKSHLAVVLQKYGVTQWKTLVLSNEIFFT